MRAGATFRRLPQGWTGVWSVWSPSSEAPGAHFLVPADERARAHGKSYITVVLRKDPATGREKVAKVLDSHRPRTGATS